MGNVILKSYSDKKSDIKILIVIVSVFLIIVWLCTPPGNKFAQLSLFGSNTQYFMAKIFNPDIITEYQFHRKNVRYNVDMGNKKAAYREMNLAINSLPKFISDDVLYKLYQDRGNLKLYYGDYKGALDDFLLIKEPSFEVKFKTAVVMNALGYSKLAINYCNELINADANSYYGFACIADVYATAGKTIVAVKSFDLLIDRVPGKPRYYIERANYKKMLGDTIGYEEDIAKAKSLFNNVDINATLVNETLHPKKYVMTDLR